MSHSNLIKKIFLSGIFCLNINNAIASQVENITCPTIEEIKQFKLFNVSSDYFNKKTNGIIFSGRLWQNIPLKDGSWSFWINDLSTNKDSNIKDSLNAAIEKLEPVSITSFQYDYSLDFDTHKVVKTPICFYQDPNDDSVHAIASYYKKVSLALLTNK